MGAIFSDSRHYLGHHLDHMLAVIEHQEELSGRQMFTQQLGDRVPVASLLRVDAECRGERRKHAIFFIHRRETRRV